MERAHTRDYNGGVPLPFQTATELLHGIPEAESRMIAGLFTERQYFRDAAIFYAGSDSDSLFIVKTGLVKLVSLSENGTETILHILRHDDVFGELLLLGGARPFTAVAITDVRVDVLSRENFQEILSSCPAFTRNYTRLLARRLMKVEKEFAVLLHAWAYHRLAKELLHLSEDLGVDTPAGTRIGLRLTHEDLANLIGTSRETVTIQLSKFEEMGLIRREGRNLIVDKGRLSKYVRVTEV